MLDKIKKIFNTTTPATSLHSINLSNNGLNINAEGSDDKAIAGASLVLELLRPHYDAVLVVYPAELAGFEAMLQSKAPQELMCPLDSCTSDAFTDEALEKSRTVFTLKYSLTALFSGHHEQDDLSVSRWLKGMQNLIGNDNAQCFVLMVGENPFGPDFLSKCRALGVGRVLLSDNNVSPYEGLALPDRYRLSRQPASQTNGNSCHRVFTVSELQAGHIPPMMRNRFEKQINMGLLPAAPKR